MTQLKKLQNTGADNSQEYSNSLYSHEKGLTSLLNKGNMV